MRKTVGFLLVAVLAALVLASSAAAAKPTGSLPTTLTVDPTVIQVDGFTATVSGTLTVTEPTLGTATIDVGGTRVVLHANVQADCSGHLQIDFQGVLRLNATVTFTDATGATTTETIKKTVPLHGSLDFTAQTQQQRALICDVSHLLRSGDSVQEIVDKLNQLLATL